jgi:hypothetical protein
LGRYRTSYVLLTAVHHRIAVIDEWVDGSITHELCRQQR